MQQMMSMQHSDRSRSKILYVEWHLGNFCNYSCSYCPPGLHSGSAPWVPLATIERTVAKLVEVAGKRDQRCHFEFTGGEVTLIPYFDKLLKKLSSAGCNVSFISNGSRQLDWWQDVRDYLLGITLSFHIERASLNHFIRVATFLSESVRTHVNVAMLPNRFDECLDAAMTISAQTKDVTLSLKPLLVDFGSQLYSYSEEQMRIMADSEVRSALTRKLVSSRGGMEVMFVDGRAETMVPGKIIAKGLNRWSGWLCQVGVERLSISQTGEIYRGTCRQGGRVGQVENIDDFVLPYEGIVCRKLDCTCQADIMTTRCKRFLPTDMKVNAGPITGARAHDPETRSAS